MKNIKKLLTNSFDCLRRFAGLLIFAVLCVCGVPVAIAAAALLLAGLVWCLLLLPIWALLRFVKPKDKDAPTFAQLVGSISAVQQLLEKIDAMSKGHSLPPKPLQISGCDETEECCCERCWPDVGGGETTRIVTPM